MRPAELHHLAAQREAAIRDAAEASAKAERHHRRRAHLANPPLRATRALLSAELQARRAARRAGRRITAEAAPSLFAGI